MMRERDFMGYGGNPPRVEWPGGARLALQFVLNIEEGAEQSILNGDRQSESYLHELPGRPPRVGERDYSVESMYEYGPRAGVWRILAIFRDRKLPLTAFAVGQALELCPEIGKTLRSDEHEVAGHGYRWIDYRNVAEPEERDHIRKTIDAIKSVCGSRPTGWYTGRGSQNTLRLLCEEGGFLYSSDAYNDDLPYILNGSQKLLMVPYSLVTNDMCYLLPNGFSTGADFFTLLKDSFDCLYEEGKRVPKMMSVGLHPRISGHPARANALIRFLDYVQEKQDVWVCKREEIARHWISEYKGKR